MASLVAGADNGQAAQRVLPATGPGNPRMSGGDEAMTAPTRHAENISLKGEEIDEESGHHAVPQCGAARWLPVVDSPGRFGHHPGNGRSHDWLVSPGAVTRRYRDRAGSSTIPRRPDLAAVERDLRKRDRQTARTAQPKLPSSSPLPVRRVQRQGLPPPSDHSQGRGGVQPHALDIWTRRPRLVLEADQHRILGLLRLPQYRLRRSWHGAHVSN
jgi:hypothetical protein